MNFPTHSEIIRAYETVKDQVVHTPCSYADALSNITGAEIYIKFENLQYTSSFKERGALVKLLSLDDDQRQAGVIATSAGNHAQGVAYHGRRLGVRTVIVMPTTTPNVKIDNTRALGAKVLLHGENYDEAYEYMQDIARREHLTVIHPFDDPAVIAGQGTLIPEILEDIPVPDIILLPIGGGGLAAGCALAAKKLCPNTEIVGVESELYASMQAHLKGEVPVFGTFTMAEGIAVKNPGRLTRQIINSHIRKILTVSEENLEEATLALLEFEKTVSEGAGAAGLAAIMSQPQRFKGKKVCIIITGGNIDMSVLVGVIQRGLLRSERLVTLRIHLPDRPGTLAAITRVLADGNANIVTIRHNRNSVSMPLQLTAVDITVQTRGGTHVATLLDSLKAEGYEVEKLNGLP